MLPMTTRVLARQGPRRATFHPAPCSASHLNEVVRVAQRLCWTCAILLIALPQLTAPAVGQQLPIRGMDSGGTWRAKGEPRHQRPTRSHWSLDNAIFAFPIRWTREQRGFVRSGCTSPRIEAGPGSCIRNTPWANTQRLNSSRPRTASTGSRRGPWTLNDASGRRDL